MDHRQTSAASLEETCAQQGFSVAITPLGEAAEIHAGFRVFGSVGLMHSRSSPLEVRRSHRDVAGDPAEVFVLPVHVAGDFLLQQGGQESRLGPAQTRLLAGNEPYELRQAADCAMSETYTLSFAAGELRRRLPGVDDVTRRPATRASSAFRLLERYLACLPQEANADAGLAQAVGSHVTDLVCLAFGGTDEIAERSRGAVQAARMAELRRHLAENAANPGLTVGHVAAAMGLSPRTVQMLFEAEGTSFSQALRRLRIERAVAMLGQPVNGQASIADIAFACGFADLSTFNRSFRAVTGLKPSDMRGA